jgi:hypothetical protein
MKIIGIEGMTDEQVRGELERGGRFVIFQYCISVLVMTFRRGSSIYFIRAGRSAAGRAFGYSLISLLFGWWGIPWGPIWTISTLITNCGGGRDVTAELLAPLARMEVAPLDERAQPVHAGPTQV